MPSVNSMKYFEILGIDTNAKIDEIKKKYLELVKEYHPDRYANDSDMKEVASKMFVEINEAYKNICKIYENDTFDYNDDSEQVQVDEKTYAHRFYLKGIKFFKEDDFNNALECFVSARRLDEENFDYQRMIARCLMKKPRRVYEAKDICMELIKKDTFNPDNYFLLGEIYREANINNTALHYYEKALKLGGNEAKIRKAMSLLKPQKKKYSFFNKFLAK